MNQCVSYPWMKLVQSVSIPTDIGAMLLSSTRCKSSSLDKSGDGPSVSSPADSNMNRSLSFDGRRQVWARIERQWSRRLTFDEESDASDCSTAAVARYDQTLQPIYRKIRSWLNNDPQPATYQEAQLVKKVIAAGTKEAPPPARDCSPEIELRRPIFPFNTQMSMWETT
jgi:hypothetical protein